MRKLLGDKTMAGIYMFDSASDADRTDAVRLFDEAEIDDCRVGRGEIQH
jgi:hypothetical protein